MYDWADGATARCRCGLPGTWKWCETHFSIDHGVGRCIVVKLTKREERELRLAKGRKQRY